MLASLCGKCLHSKLSHSEHNGHFMFCAPCQKLCEKDDYYQTYMPSDITIITKIQVSLP